MGGPQNLLWSSEGNSSQKSVCLRFRNCPVCGSPRGVASASPTAWGWVPRPCPRSGSPLMWWASVAWLHSPTPHHLALGRGPALSFHTYRILPIPLQGSSDSSNSGCTLISIGFGFIGYLCLFCFVLPHFPMAWWRERRSGEQVNGVSKPVARPVGSALRHTSQTLGEAKEDAACV